MQAGRSRARRAFRARPATVEQLIGMKVGDVIELDMSDHLTAKVDGVPVFECRYGTQNGRYAIKVDRILATRRQ
jgi:flagellar motor switch protein FliM